MTSQRYSVGIDLGTTHCVLSYVDLESSDGEAVSLDVLNVPQLTSPGTVGHLQQLPSFIYQAHEAEISREDCALPWDAHSGVLVGEVARQLGSKTPIRLVSSAKSWLCHAGVDCRAPLLPVQAPEEVSRLSPLDASVAYLRHLHAAWNHQFPDYPLSGQLLTITVPASFDPAARELTVEAARLAGLGGAVLLEEPQAAVYSWIHSSEGEWRNQVTPGDILLVVDIGGGTTDFSLVAVTEDDGNLVLNRVAIGDHILLGGDNMDLALAFHIRSKLEAEGKRLEPWQVQALTQGCREAKEKLLSQPDLDEWALVVPGRSSSLMGGALRTSLRRDEISDLLVDGFFPRVDVAEKPQASARTALTTVSLPYARDARMTAHLASFLSRQVDAVREQQGGSERSQFARPTALLLNGGVFRAESLTERLVTVINDWLVADHADEVSCLVGADLDLAVAKGAAYYGYVRQGKGVRIRGGTAASYYVGVESALPAVPGFPPEMEALCIAPFGMEEGSRVDVTTEVLGLVIGEPVQFRFFASTVRRDDAAGVRLPSVHGEELDELGQVEITLDAGEHKAGEVVPVILASHVTEVGTLQLQAVARDSAARWNVEFQVRQASGDSQSASGDTAEEKKNALS